MDLPVGIVWLGNIRGPKGNQGEKGDTGSLAFLEVEVLDWDEAPTADMVGPESARGAKLGIPLPMPGPELLEVRDQAVAARDQAEVFAAGVVQLQDETMAQVTADDTSMFVEQANQRFSMGRVGVSDFVNSWWCLPRSVYDPLRGMQYQGGVRRDGTIEVARIDTRRGTAERVALGQFEPDDHNVPAILVWCCPDLDSNKRF